VRHDTPPSLFVESRNRPSPAAPNKAISDHDIPFQSLMAKHRIAAKEARTQANMTPVQNRNSIGLELLDVVDDVGLDADLMDRDVSDLDSYDKGWDVVCSRSE